MLEHRPPAARPVLIAAALVLLVAVLAGCSRAPEGQGPQAGAKPLSPGAPVYRFAVHPLHNPAKLIEAYQPLVDHLNSRLQGARLTLEASRDYASFEEKYQARKPEFILPNPWQTLQAIKIGYRVIAMAGEPRDFTGIFVVRRDSGLKRPADLKGKAVSYPSSTALAACIMPQYFLHSQGIDVNADIDNRYVGSQESSIMNAYLKLTAAGATWPTPWRAFQREHPGEAAELKVMWETEPLVNNSVMVRNDVAAGVAEQVRTQLVGLDASADGKAILAGMETARFLPAADQDYDVVRRYIARFERDVRPVQRQ
ncbi:MAG: phosphate/phosphite/phosphonate ABC transporter substrate-binding protein [Sterolibacterium sp.]|jgi:phosphonate transport system substrate-binding protein